MLLLKYNVSAPTLNAQQGKEKSIALLRNEVLAILYISNMYTPFPLHMYSLVEYTDLSTKLDSTSTQCDCTQYDTTQYDTTQYDTTQYDTTQCDTTQYETTQYETTQYNTT